jgi:phage shock protein A
MIKQVILDMQNQLLQVKTQVAISIADQHVLEKKLQEAEENERQWMHRAELAVDKKDEALARAAVERSMSYRSTAASFRQQVENQKAQVDNLKSAPLLLQQKMAEAESKSDILIAQHRRARALAKANEASNAMGDNTNAAAFDRMKTKVRRHEATAQAHADLGSSDDVNAKFAAMEKQEEIDRLLKELKARRNA